MYLNDYVTLFDLLTYLLTYIHTYLLTNESFTIYPQRFSSGGRKQRNEPANPGDLAGSLGQTSVKRELVIFLSFSGFGKISRTPNSGICKNLHNMMVTL